MIKKTFLIFNLLLIGFVNAQNPIDRALPSDSYFYNPTINTANQFSFPNGSSTGSALQSMIINLSNAGGGVLTINSGHYEINEIIHLKSNVHIRVHPDVVFKTTVARGAMFQAGYDASYALVENWSIQSKNGEKFTFNFEDLMPLDKIRAIQLGNAKNFKVADFIVLDNFTKFNAISSGAVGNDLVQGSAKFASFGIFENLDIKKAHYGYGLIQCQVGQDILYKNLSGEGGVTLRFESGYKGLADRYITDKTPIINNVYGRNISCINGAHALMMSPHTITQGLVDVRGVFGESCEAVVSVNFGFLSEKKGQSDDRGNAINGHNEGTFSEESVVANVSAIYGINAQVRAARLRHIPCALRNYISKEKNLDEESYQAPALAPIYYLAQEDYISLGNPKGRFKIVIENVTHSGFSSEIRADGLITDGGENDFEGCDIDGTPIWIKGDDKNTPNPLQTSFVADVLNLDDNTIENKILIFQKNKSEFLTVRSSFNTEIKVFNLLGQLVDKVFKIQNEIQINISKLPNSTYLLHFNVDGKQVIKRIIIQ